MPVTPKCSFFSPKLPLNKEARLCEEWDTLPSQDHHANALWVIDLKPSTKDDVQQHLSGINFPMAQRMWDDFPRHETRRVYINTIPCTFSSGKSACSSHKSGLVVSGFFAPCFSHFCFNSSTVAWHLLKDAPSEQRNKPRILKSYNGEAHSLS